MTRAKLTTDDDLQRVAKAVANPARWRALRFTQHLGTGTLGLVQAGDVESQGGGY